MVPLLQYCVMGLLYSYYPGKAVVVLLEEDDERLTRFLCTKEQAIRQSLSAFVEKWDRVSRLALRATWFLEKGDIIIAIFATTDASPISYPYRAEFFTLN